MTKLIRGISSIHGAGGSGGGGDGGGGDQGGGSDGSGPSGASGGAWRRCGWNPVVEPTYTGRAHTPPS